MKNILKDATLFTKIEFWALTTIFSFITFFFIIDGLDGPSAFDNSRYVDRFEKAGIEFRFYKHFFIPQLIRNIWLFVSIISLNFIVIPKIFRKEEVLKNLGWLALIFVITVLVFGVTGTYLLGYLYGTGGKDETDQSIFMEDGVLDSLWLLFVLAVYTGIKYGGVYLYNVSERIQAKYKFMRREAIVATALWLVGLLFLGLGRAERELITGWFIVVPSTIALYLASFHWLIPRSLRYNNYQFLFYFLKCAAILFVSFFAIYLAHTVVTDETDEGAAYSAFNSFFQLIVTVPVTWALYKRYLKGNEEITVLQKELKRSSASIDFLRSQINPHFLFNALNTLYGTAIQENADRTSEGIQKLGDMMRFMLQENLQDKISLAREIDYLNNYISLQKLRTDTSPGIRIETQIQDRENLYQIAPMLLIPFVENAFKHGISFREPSHIKVGLEIKEGTLYFDVYNSKHNRSDNDPEKDKSGIGLENVKQRLKLSYLNKHELIIRDTPKEFFVHLTIQLAKFA
jgi:hypothetical protein